VIDATSVVDNSSLERVRIFPDIMEETTCRGRRPCIKAAPKSAGESTGTTKMPFKAFPSCERLTGPAVRIKDAIRGISHSATSPALE
jgi:hypothetical protein